MFSLDGKAAVVTGGASGIGQAVAEIFAAHGACIHILDLNETQAESVAGKDRDPTRKAEKHRCGGCFWPTRQRVRAEIRFRLGAKLTLEPRRVPHRGEL